MFITNIWGQLIGIIIFIVFVIAVVYQMRRQSKAFNIITIPQILPSEGFLIPFGYVAFGPNDLVNIRGLGTSIKLFDDHFSFNALSDHSYKYSEVNDIGYMDYSNRAALVITFSGTDNNFYGGSDKKNLKEIFNFFQSKGCELTGKAQKF